MRILLLADIHIGSIKDMNYVYNITTDIIEKEVVFKKTDIVVILGDYFDRLFKVNEEHVSTAINVMSYLIRACERSKTKIRIVYGTESHEMNQYKLFNYHFTSTSVDIKLFTTAEDEEIDCKKILYIPEEYISDKRKFYKKYLYSDKHYDYIFGHGIIEEGMPLAVKFNKAASQSTEKQVPRFKSGELHLAGDIVVFGHYHCYTDIGDKVYYLGSLFRNSFGEEIPKGYGIIEDNSFQFIENNKAYIYKTYEFDKDSNIYKNADTILTEIERIKSENEDVFKGEKVGKIRIKFNIPDTADSSFRDNLKSIISNDKLFSINIQECGDDTSEDLQDDVEDEYDFVLDSSMDITDKIYSFINKKYDIDISLDQIKRYISEPLKI